VAKGDGTFDAFAHRIVLRAQHVEKRADYLVVRAFKNVAQSVILHNPYWSGQSRMNWTAAIAKSIPPRRFVGLPRSNTGDAEGTQKTINRDEHGFTDSQGNEHSIGLLESIHITQKAAYAIANTYKHPSRPQKNLKGIGLGTKRAPSIYLSNSISYVGKLWSGAWPSNPRTLKSEVESALSKLRGRGVKLLKE
jgi:hypothetical protein